VSTPSLRHVADRVHAAAPFVAAAANDQRIDALRRAASELRAASDAILAANAEDVASNDLTPTAKDRLVLTPERIESMAAGLELVAELPDPVGKVVEERTLGNGLHVERVQVPLGVVGIIYENRPNVTSDVAGLCVRSGNVAFLRGSASALHSNVAVVAALQAGFAAAGLPRDAAALVDDVSHQAAVEFMQLDDVLDVLIPRGGPSLIASMRKHATVPIILDGDGNCHVYVDKDADLAMATEIIVNAKTQRPGVCNAMESLVLHQAVAGEILAALETAMPQVRLLGDGRAQALDARIEPASEDDFSKEFLDLIATVAIVDDVDEAIDHIAVHGSGHSEAIVTENTATADRFLARVDAAAVLANASTRFVDGFELGLGAEVGISTQKLHARGPMGLDALMGIKWVIRGEGQVRR
jgi:glutamate-5-semialdehyde dehydrogenase